MLIIYMQNLNNMFYNFILLNISCAENIIFEGFFCLLRICEVIVCSFLYVYVYEPSIIVMHIYVRNNIILFMYSNVLNSCRRKTKKTLLLARLLWEHLVIKTFPQKFFFDLKEEKNSNLFKSTFESCRTCSITTFFLCFSS